MITINISNSTIVGLENLSRVLRITKYTEDFIGQAFTVPYSIDFYNTNQETVGIPTFYGELIASNDTILNINTTTFQAEPVASENTTPMGQYDYFKILQKQLSNESIITAQVMQLNARGFFS